MYIICMYIYSDPSAYKKHLHFHQYNSLIHDFNIGPKPSAVNLGIVTADGLGPMLKCPMSNVSNIQLECKAKDQGTDRKNKKHCIYAAQNRVPRNGCMNWTLPATLLHIPISLPTPKDLNALRNLRKPIGIRGDLLSVNRHIIIWRPPLKSIWRPPLKKITPYTKKKYLAVAT